MTLEDDLYRDSPSTLTEEGGGDGSGEGGGGTVSKGRKGLFKKKATSTSITSVLKRTSSVSSGFDEQPEVSSNLLFEYRKSKYCDEIVSYRSIVL